MPLLRWFQLVVGVIVCGCVSFLGVGRGSVVPDPRTC